MGEQTALPFGGRPADWLAANDIRVEVDPPRKAGLIDSGFVGQRDINPHADACFVHVINPRAGGEIRGYVLIEHRLHLRLPCYSGEWPEMDMAVGDHLGALVVPYRAGADGAVRGC
jgi:hypothetical protein